ncbi:uncharacterized protein [Typha angustifolia]|uniref:uncharacterized protein n=1 Tax=Typha angustifolia TaxID=59011 RepID=UPI003C303786
MAMAKPSFLLLLYLTIAVVVVLLLSAPATRPYRSHRRLKLRSSFSFSPSPPATAGSGAAHTIPFDPIISEIELRREDREWERAHYPEEKPAPGMESAPEWKEFGNAEDYINDEDHFNVTSRILLLFPKVDVAPTDGFITPEELAAWNLVQAQNDVMHRTKRDMKLHDKNRDGFVSFDEYERPSWAGRIDDNDSANDGVGWWNKDHFNASDIDGDGLLNLTEFNDFLHPSDSANPKLIYWLCEEEVRARDKDNDGKLNFQEFFNELFNLVQNHHEAPHESEEAPAKKLFSDLDQDKDGFLSAAELKPVIMNIHPSEHQYAKQQADYMISQADHDKDGRLSLSEMLENPYIFYNAIFSEDDYGFHDEFR